MGVWEYGSMGMKNSFSIPEFIFIFSNKIKNLNAQVPHSHTPILSSFSAKIIIGI